jgi:Bacterial archaeo-eukaryotic release factor family 10
MITYGEVEKLRSIRAADLSVLSLYVYVPPDLTDVSQLQAQAAELIGAAAGRMPDALHREDEMLAERALAERARGCLGQTLGIFVSGQLSLLEVVPLPGRVAERAVVSARPHLRPLLAALARYPDHRIVVIDHRHAWLLSVAGNRIEVVSRAPVEAAPSTGFGGWYLEPYHGLQRVTELAPHLYQDVAVILDGQARHGSPRPLVVGGESDSITHLLALLRRAVLTDYAGSFAADPHALTLARARELAAPIVSHWAERRDRQLVEAALRPGMPTAIGVEECLAAVNAGTADQLLIADEALVPGFHCERCDVLSVSSDGCCDWGAATWSVPDLLEEMAWRTLHAGGQVVSVRTLPCTAAARLH